MRSQKGFTLIELLAVILVLGIIALIAVPVVNNVIKQSKRGAFEATIHSIINAAENKCQIEQLNDDELTETYTFEDGVATPKLDVKGSLPKSGTVTVDTNCNTTVSLSDNTFTATKSNASDTITITE